MSLLSALPASTSDELRAAALRFLRETGLPTKKTEAWRFTSVRDLVSSSLPVRSKPPALELDGATRSNEPPTELGSTLPNVDFVAVNTALHDSVQHLTVPRATKATIRVRYDGAEGASYPRVLLRLEPGAEATLVETFGDTGPLLTPVTEVLVGAGAKLDHVRLHRGARSLVGAFGARLERDARLDSRVVTLGGTLTRFDARVTLAGPGAEAGLHGAFVTRDGEHVDHHIFVDHLAPHGTSRQSYRGVLDGKSTAVFDGQTHIRPHANASEAHQSSRNILLSDSASMFTKPHLEIENDEVVASHGATVGALDDEQLFYLRARGIGRELARAILVDGFLREVVTGIADAALRAQVLAALAAAIPNGNTIPERGDEP